MATLTLLDIAKLNGNDALVGLIEDNLKTAPEWGTIPARTIRGTSYTTVVRDSFPTVGFRKANEAETATKSAFHQELVECYILSSLIEVDKAVAMAYEDGAAALEAIEASGVVKAAMQTVGRQVYYGQDTTYSGDVDGFPGFMDGYDSTNNVIDAGGTSATTGSSAWLVKFGPQDVQFVVGNGGSMQLSEWRVETISGVPSYVADLTTWIGLQIINENSLVRIKDATADSGKGMSDAHIIDALACFPAGVVPDAIFMSRRSAGQLQKSRTITVTTNGGTTPGDTTPYVQPVTAAFGIPIYVTDSISNVEALS